MMAGSFYTPASPHLRLTYPAPFVAHVEIHRPEKHNAWIPSMWTALPPLFTHLSNNPDCRAIIISGAGTRAFTTGLDIEAAFSSNQPSIIPSTESHDPARKAFTVRQYIHHFQTCLSSISECTKPVIAAIHGFCIGLGVDLILCADVRICTSSTVFSVKEVDLGLAADVGTLSRLPKLCGSGSWVKDVCLTGRVFKGREAKREGLVSWVGEEGKEVKEEVKEAEKEKQTVINQALQWAVMVASKSPVAVQGTKHLLDWSWERSVRDGLGYTALWNSVALQTGDVGESMRATKERRGARYEKL